MCWWISTAAVDFIIANGTSQTTQGNWILSFDELEEKTGLCAEGRPFLQELLGDMLSERPEVADLVIEDGCFDVDYYLNFCPNCQPDANRQTLRNPIQTPMEDIHLLHIDEEIEPAAIVKLSSDTLTDAGKEEWADVLDAKSVPDLLGYLWSAVIPAAELIHHAGRILFRRKP